MSRQQTDHLNDIVLRGSPGQIQLAIRVPQFAEGSRGLISVCQIFERAKLGELTMYIGMLE